MKIVWNNEYNIGIKEIDEQHQHFFFLINEIDKSVQIKELDRLGTLVAEIFDHTAKHFSTEEEYFYEYHYDNLQDHVSEHRKLIIDALDFKIRFEKEGLKIIPEFTNFLNDWMIKHISTSDFAYGRYIKKIQ